VIGVVAVIAAACAAICGSLPALLVGRRSVVDVLRRGTTPAPRELTLRRMFVISEVALAFVLLVSLTLVGRSLLTMLKVNPGFDAGDVLTLQVALPAASYPSAEFVVSFYSTLQGALEERLGPNTIAMIDEIPLTGDRGRGLVRARRTDIGREAVVREAGTAYFDVMRIPIVAGRSFEPRDNSSAPSRVVISKSLAAELFASESAIGRQIWLGTDAQVSEVIGVVGDVKHRSLDEAPLPTMYLSAWQTASLGRIVVVRSARAVADVITVVREEVARLDRNLPVYGTRPLLEFVARSPGVPARRVLTATFMGFALLAVVLGGIGLFGVVAHDVASRRAELALRLALGAHPKRLVSATLGQGVFIVGSGLVVGAVLSLLATRALSSVVLTTDRSDVLTIVGLAAMLMVAGAGAVLPAARRAARTDPLMVLRSE
jgi:predicted permease